MKDKNKLIGVFCVTLALLWMFSLSKQQAGSPTKTATVLQQTSKAPTDKPLATPIKGAEQASTEKPSIFTIENDVIAVHISNIGGGIQSVTLKNHKQNQKAPDPIAFNTECDIPALSIIDDNGLNNSYNHGRFEVISQSSTEIQLIQQINNGLSVVRKYSLFPSDSKQHDGHVIASIVHLRNTSPQPIDLGTCSLFLGIMPPTPSDVTGEYLNFGCYNGKKDRFVKIRDFQGSSGFLGLGKKQPQSLIISSEPIVWGSIKNQFFTAILTPETPTCGYSIFPMPVQMDASKKQEEGIAAAVSFHPGILHPNHPYTLSSDFYVGPKDFSRLSRLGHDQSHIMQFGFFGLISEALLRLSQIIHSIIPNWGWTIIILTILIKACLWPLTNAQVRSSKRMAKIQEPLKLLKERYKNSPQKLQQETLKLFRENKVNPASGCLPILIQIPIFFGLYYMLRTSSDLRFAHFLWIQDLSLPDTIAHIGYFPINILPFIMGATMIWQMHSTPMPTMDNRQKMMFKVMPIVFLLCCYNFPSGLVLYWTVQNLLTIIQQYTISRIKDEETGVSVHKGEKRTLSNSHLNKNKRRSNNVRS